MRAGGPASTRGDGGPLEGDAPRHGGSNSASVTSRGSVTCAAVGEERGSDDALGKARLQLPRFGCVEDSHAMPIARCFSKWGLAALEGRLVVEHEQPAALVDERFSPRSADSLSQAGIARRCKATSASTDRSRFVGREAQHQRARARAGSAAGSWAGSRAAPADPGGTSAPAGSILGDAMGSISVCASQPALPRDAPAAGPHGRRP